MDIHYLFKVLIRKRLILIIVPLLAAIAAFLLTFTGKRLYKSNCQIATGFTINNVIRVNNETMFNISEVEFQFNNLIENLKSKNIINLLSYSLLLHDLKDSKKSFRKLKNDNSDKQAFTKEELKKAVLLTEGKLERMEPLSASNKDDILIINLLKAYGYDYASLRDGLSISRINLSDYIFIEYLSENAELSAFVVNAFVDEFIRFNNRSSSTQSKESIKFLKDKLAQKDTTRNQKTILLNLARASAGGGGGLLEGINARLGEYDTQLELEKQKRQTARLQKANVERQLNGSESSFENTSTINQRIDALRQKQKSFQRIATTNNAYKDSITNITRQLSIEEEKFKYAGAGTAVSKREDLINKRELYDVQIQVSEESINSITNQINTLRGSISNSTSQSGTIETLQKDVDAANEEFIQAQRAYDRAQSVSQASSFGAIKKLLEGQPADEPETRKTGITTIFAWAISLGICIFVIIILETLDSSIKIPSVFQRLTDIKTIGILNKLNPKGMAKAEKAIESVFLEEEDEEIEEITFRELIRKLRFEIENSGGKIFLFTSTKPHEGKTTLILALATSLSVNQKKVLIIDTNFMNNSLTQILKANKTLESSMVDDYDHEFIMTKQENIVSKSHIKNIDIIGCEGGNYSPTEVFPEKKFSNQILNLTSHYDYIFLEGGALNLYSDSKELANYVDKVVVIFSAQSTIKPADKDSIAYLKNLKNKLVGAVLNKVDLDNLEL